MIKLGIAPRLIDFQRGVPSPIDSWFNQVTTRWNLQQKASAPVVGEVPNQQWAIWKNTATGDVKLVVNDNGTLKSIYAYTFPITVTGGFALNFNVTGTTNITLPVTGTLATLNGVETFTNKTITSPTINGGTVNSATFISASSGGAFQSGAFLSSGSTYALEVRDTGATGAGLLFAGNGAVTPNKVIRARAGNLEVVNSGNTAIIASLTDAGALSNLTNLTVNASGGGVGIQTTTTNGTNSLVVQDTGVNGANIHLIGDGATTPDKYIRATNGSLGIVNSAYTTQVLTVSDTGKLTTASQIVPGKAPLVWAGPSVGQSVPNATNTTIALDTTIYAPDGGYSGVTYKFTPTVAGYYFIVGQIAYDLTPGAPAGTTVLASIWQNGAGIVCSSQQITSGANNYTPITSGLVLMNGTTDYLTLVGWQNAGGARNTIAGGYLTYMSAFLIRAT